MCLGDSDIFPDGSNRNIVWDNLVIDTLYQTIRMLDSMVAVKLLVIFHLFHQVLLQPIILFDLQLVAKVFFNNPELLSLLKNRVV